MRKILRFLGLALLALLLAMLVITFTNTSTQPKVKWEGKPAADTAAINHFSQALQFQTVTYDHLSDGEFKMAELRRMQDWMRKTYPLCFAKAKVTIFPEGSMLFQFPGPDNKDAPAMYLAHLDVVPVDSADLKYWKFAPFAGKVDHDTIYGRGVLDDKVVAIALLEAMEQYIKAGKKLQRGVYFAFGHDEESGGHKGASVIAKYLKSQKIRTAFIMDEGLGVTEGIVPGIKAPTALIGLAEKGYVSIKLKVKMDGGHSSMPKADNATSVLTAALNRIDKHRFHEKFSEPMHAFLKQGAPEMGFGYRLLFSNLWATSPLVKMVMRGNEKTAAAISTVHVTTRINAGVKDNVVPNVAEAMVNFRIIPGESVQSTIDEVRKVVNDPRVQLEKHWDFTEPSPVTKTTDFSWNVIRKSIHQTFENVVSLPGQVLAVTDCQHYYEISDYVYRFVPLRINNANASGIHGINERMAVNNYMECIRFYERMFENTQGLF